MELKISKLWRRSMTNSVASSIKRQFFNTDKRATSPTQVTALSVSTMSSTERGKLLFSVITNSQGKNSYNSL